MIEIKKLGFNYPGGKEIFSDVNLTINANEKVALIGANGAGKSTLLKLILGLLNPNGEIIVDGLQLNKNNLSEIRKKVGYVLQDSDDQMFMPTVLQDMIFGPVNYGLSVKEATEKAMNVLKQLGIEELADCYNHKISGGQKRMGAIATILTLDPEVIMMDEPSSSLDPKNRRKVINVLKSLSQTLIIATHDLDLVLDVCDRVILINDGKIIADGKVDEILYDQQLLELNNLELPFSILKRDY